MNRRDSDHLPRPAARFAPWWALGAILVGLVGCTGPQQARLQSGEETEAERYGLKTIGDVTSVGNADPIALGTVGLVVGLEGTGGEPAHDNYYTMLTEMLTKEGIKDVKQELANPNHALVVVTAMMPPGSNKGDPFDVEVTLPPHAGKATSLRGGYLRQCTLFNYDYTKNISPNYAGSNVPLKGKAEAKCEGPVLVGLGDGDEAVRVKRGRIWSGARCIDATPLMLLLNTEYQQARIASIVADRINGAFRGGPSETPDGSTAVAHNNLAIELRVPPAYRLNMPRYLRVVRLIPLEGSADQPVGKGPDARPYRAHLAEDLLDPARTVTSALRLEALGQESIPALKAGMQSTHPLVRFCSAEALAYLDCAAGGEELGRAVAKQPMLRAFGLTALASLDESVSTFQLRELATTSTDDETRYGAFRALRALNERDPLVQGELLNDSFWLHRVAPDAAPLVHISTTRRAEIVLFGEEPTLKAPFSFLAGEFAVTATPDEDRCTVSRFPHKGGVKRKQCSLKIDEVLHTMAELGGSYPETIELLQQANRCECLSCRVCCDALPQAVSVFDLARAGKNGDLLNADGQIVAAPQDLGATPTLYTTTGGKQK
jgi:Flagellar P-ring protein